MKKLFLKLGLLFVLVLLGFVILGDHLTKVNPYVDIVDQYQANLIREKGVDVLFLGSSKAFSTYNPRVFNEEIGVQSFNLGNSGQRITTTAFVMEESVKGPEKPELLVVDVYYHSLKTARSAENISFQFNNYDAFDLSLNKIRHSLSQFSVGDLPYLYVKALRNHQGWKSLKENRIDHEDNKFLVEKESGYRGYQYRVSKADEYPPLESISIPKISPEKNVLEMEQKNNLDQFFAALKKFDIPVLFTVSPSLRNLDNKSYPRFSASMGNYIKQAGYDYLDLNGKIVEMGLTSHNFRDEIHLNNTGATKVSEYLASWISRTYAIGKIAPPDINIEDYIRDGGFEKNGLRVNKVLKDKMMVTRVDYLQTGKKKTHLIVELETNGEDFGENDIVLFHATPRSDYLKYLSKRARARNAQHEIWDFKPKIFEIGNKKYLLRPVNSDVEALSSLKLGVYGEKGYRAGDHKIIDLRF